MMGIMNTVAATVIAANAGVADLPDTGIVTQVDLSGDFISTCDTGFELGPHDQLQPGEKVWVSFFGKRFPSLFLLELDNEAPERCSQYNN